MPTGYAPVILPYKHSESPRLDQPLVVITAAPCCMPCYVTEPLRQKRFKMIRERVPNVEFIILTGVNHWGPKDNGYAGYHRAPWKRYLESTIPEAEGFKRMILMDELKDSDMTQDSARQASIAVLTASIQDKPGSFDIYETISSYISNSVFEWIRNPKNTDELRFMVTRAAYDLHDRGIEFNLDLWWEHYSTGIGSQLLEEHFKLHEMVSRDAYHVPESEKPPIAYPEMFLRQSPEMHFTHLWPLFNMGLDRLVDEAVDELTCLWKKAEKERLI